MKLKIITKTIIIVFSIVLMALILLAIFITNNKTLVLMSDYLLVKTKPKNLEFSVKSCDSNINPYDSNALGIRETRWLDDTTMNVKATISSYCGGESIMAPSYRINNDKLILKYTSVKDTALTKCLCAKEIEYTIRDLPSLTYDVILEKNSL